MTTTAPGATAAAQEATNFVIFLTDDQGWGDLGCNGHPRIQTPNLDRFAEEGVRLTQCYSACSVCSPSRSAILTGRTPYRNGVWRWIPDGSQYHLRASEISIAKLLQQRGYATCHAGKWHLNGKFNSPEQPQPDAHGYDWWLATQNNAAPHHLNPINYVRNGEPTGRLEGPSAVVAVNEAIRWLDQKPAEKPFFLTLWTHEPHLPIESAEEFMASYQDIEDEGIRQHHGNITQLDHAFGLLMKKLDDLSLRDRTFVFFTSDNGPEGNGTKGRTRGSTGGLRGRKRHSHEGGIRVPGILRWPEYFRRADIKAGSTSDVPVIGSDVFTTVCEIMGIPLPDDRTIDGANMLPALAGLPVLRQQPLYWRNHLAPAQYRVALRENDWKIIADDKLERFELYNLRTDWQETTDLSTKHPTRLETLKAKLLAHDRAVLAEGPDWWKNDRPRRRKPRKGASLEPGSDKSGTGALVHGGTLAKHELGVELSSRGESFAVWPLPQPVSAGVLRIRTAYQSRVSSATRNACLVLGDKASNGALLKVGSMIGMGAHGIFHGSWDNLSAGTTRQESYAKDRLIEVDCLVDLDKRSVVALIDGHSFEFPLPESIRRVSYSGVYIKGTTSAFRRPTIGADSER